MIGNGFKQANIIGLNDDGTVEKTAAQNLMNAKNVGLFNYMQVNPCRSMSVAQQVKHVMDEISADLYEFVWVSVQLNARPSCSWANHDFESNCQYIKDFMKEFNLNDKWAGVVTDDQTWTQYMGGR